MTTKADLETLKPLLEQLMGVTFTWGESGISWGDTKVWIKIAPLMGSKYEVVYSDRDVWFEVETVDVLKSIAVLADLADQYPRRMGMTDDD